jgi:pyridinium-3,5-bisthiocarboxylic acid mononucleotide nickel chelatase
VASVTLVALWGEVYNAVPMRLAYFDCFSGVTGAMALGSLVHAGADLDHIAERLERLPTIGFVLERETVDAGGISATRVHVKVLPQDIIRTYASIRIMLEKTDLPERARWTAQRIFHRLAAAEAKIHNKEPDVVTFHESGEVDALVEVVGCALALDMLDIDRVYASPLPTGLGMVRTDKGIMPVPAPVVMELLRGVPTYSRGIPAELVNATGAAILASVAEGYGDMPTMRADVVGYGAGLTRMDFPNVVRVVVGEAELLSAVPATTTPEEGEVFIEAHLSERAARHGDSLLAEAFRAGASEAWLVPVVTRADGHGAILSMVSPANGVEPLLRLARDKADGGLIRVDSVRRPS